MLRLLPISRSLPLLSLLWACAAASALAQEAPTRLGLVTSYAREKLELNKRDIALKMIDSGVLKLGETTAEDVGKIFGKDWTPDLKVAGAQSYGIISFFRQPDGTAADAQNPYYGWYMVVYYNTTDRKVFDWDLSNVHK
jgi:hypothetical protein